MFTSLSLSGIEIIVFRDDLNHVTVSGNKLHKLAPNIEAAKAANCSRVLSFGGPYSNHLHALAWACKESGLDSVGVVRGELHSSLTQTLIDCQNWGMQLIPSSRSDYREYQEVLSSFTEPCLASELNLPLLGNSSKTLVVPEGGSNKVAIESLAKAYSDVFNSTEVIGVTHGVCATGTGATVTGLYQAAPEHVDVIGMQAVAEQGATLDRVQGWLGGHTKGLMIEESHLGKFGKIPSALIEFIEEFEAQYSIPLDPIYTGKAMLKLSQMIAAGYFKATDKILFIHTGGLQGKKTIS